MGDELSGGMSIDLNLSPRPEQGSRTGQGNFEECILEPIDRIREGVSVRAPELRQVLIPPEAPNISIELDWTVLSTLQAGEGSVATEERVNEVPKACENNNDVLEDVGLDDGGEDENGDDNDGTFFDCNICLDVAKDPVVTCCGHLFCWPCIFRWLNMHSVVKECPVCKGELTVKNVTPIYGRSTNIRTSEEDSNLNIPFRPNARRVESWKQSISRNAYTFPSEQMIRQLERRFDSDSDVGPLHGSSSAHETSERNRSFLNRILTSRGLRGEQNPVPAVDALLYLSHNNTTGHEPLFHPIGRSQRTETPPSISSVLESAERFFESYIHSHPIARYQEQFSPNDDSDSFSSIAAARDLESRTVDTAAEIDSLVSQSTSFSRVRNEASRASNIDRGSAHASRRRPLNN